MYAIKYEHLLESGMVKLVHYVARRGQAFKHMYYVHVDRDGILTLMLALTDNVGIVRHVNVIDVHQIYALFKLFK